MIKPIETEYNGYRFRSRLEARWAYFFDLLGIKYEYEPEGFLLGAGVRYLPDFYLPEMETYVEVKPENAFEIKFVNGGVVFSKEASKYAYAAEAITTKLGKMFLIVFGDPYDAFPRMDEQSTANSYLFYVGQCPNHVIFAAANKNCGEEKFFCETKDGGKKDCSLCDKWLNITECTFPFFISKSTFLVSEQAILREHTMPISQVMNWRDAKTSAKYKARWQTFQDAQTKARQVRFEHGETPEVPRSLNDWRGELRPMTDAEFERWLNEETT